MTQRITGWTAPDVDIHPGRLAVSFVLRANKNKDDVPCVAVIGADRVFAESEVVVILRAVMSAAEDGPYIPNYESMREAASRFGLSFD